MNHGKRAQSATDFLLQSGPVRAAHSRRAAALYVASVGKESYHQLMLGAESWALRRQARNVADSHQFSR